METISTIEMIMRLSAILLIGGILGFERESTPQPAGIRTHILIGLGACSVTILALILPELYPDSVQDSSRIISSIMSGIGFLGAGAIIKLGVDTRGVTTAANIWVTAAIGICVGAGLYILAVAITLLILIDLIFITKLKGVFMSSTRYSTIKISFSRTDTQLKKVLEAIKLLPLSIVSRHISEDTKNIDLKLIVKTKKDIDIVETKNQLKKMGEIRSLSISETVDL